MSDFQGYGTTTAGDVGSAAAQAFENSTKTLLSIMLQGHQLQRQDELFKLEKQQTNLNLKKLEYETDPATLQMMKDTAMATLKSKETQIEYYKGRNQLALQQTAMAAQATKAIADSVANNGGTPPPGTTISSKGTMTMRTPAAAKPITPQAKYQLAKQFAISAQPDSMRMLKINPTEDQINAQMSHVEDFLNKSKMASNVMPENFPGAAVPTDPQAAQALASANQVAPNHTKSLVETLRINGLGDPQIGKMLQDAGYDPEDYGISLDTEDETKK